MTTALQIDTKGLDQFGESTLTFSELKQLMDNTKIIALLDAPFTDIVAAQTRLEIRRDGTYIAVPERTLPLHRTFSATTALIDAMTASAMNPGEESRAQLRLAEMEFDETQLKCIQRSIHEACTSEEIEFKARIGELNMTFRLPHKATITSPQNTGSQSPPNDEIRIKRIQRFIDAVSSSGLAAFLTIGRHMPSIKAGDKIRVRISTNAKRFLRALDAQTSKHD